MREMPVRLLLAACATVCLCACTSESNTNSGPDMAIVWARDAAEYDALAMQAYGSAGADLQRLIADKSWTALPGQRNYPRAGALFCESLPPGDEYRLTG